MTDCDQPPGTSVTGDDCDDTSAIILACCTTDAADGDLILTADGELEGGTYIFDRVEVPAAFTLRGTGDRPIVIYARSVNIAGTVDVSGASGADSGPTTLPDGGAAGPGGGGGGGGGDCGNGPGAGGAPNGVAAVSTDSPGGNGGLPFGLDDGSNAIGGEFNCGNGGGGGGHVTEGGLGLTAFDGCVPEGDAGLGGLSYGSASMEDLFLGGAGGGGGAGGAIWLHADIVTMTGLLDASAGQAAPLDPATSLSGAGGDGSLGRVRVSAADAEVTGTVFSGSLFDAPSYPDCDPQ